MMYVDHKMKLNFIPPELVFKDDQTPSLHICFCGKADNGYPWIPNCAHCRSVRQKKYNFVVTLASDFLPMQIIYAGKTKQSQPRGFVFPKGFSKAKTHNIDQIRNAQAN